jgi:glutathione peroxidase
MTRTFALAFLAAITVVTALSAQKPMSFYDLKTTTLDGKPADLAQYKGQVSLVVNVASKCGYTPQYEGLEKLQREMKGKGFNVLGFPSNDFGGQEPGTAQEIASFCKLTYDVTFPMFEKVVTRKGTAQSPIYTSWAVPGSCQHGTSASTSWTNRARLLLSSKAASRRRTPRCVPRLPRRWPRANPCMRSGHRICKPGWRRARARRMAG